MDLLPQLVAQIVVAEGGAAAAQVDDLGAVGREGRVGVLPGDSVVRCGARAVRPSCRHPDVPALRVAPGHEGELGAVRRERGRVLQVVALGQALGRAAGRSIT